MSDEHLSEFERKVRERRINLGLPASHDSNKMPEFDHTEFVPNVEITRNPDEEALDNAIKNLDIVHAYNKWCGKSKPKPHGNQKEGIKVSCPNPAHPDKVPSAWLNTEKKLWFCRPCEMGGDAWDIAAWHFGYSVPRYKQDSVQFRELREKMGADLGFHIVRGVTGTFLVAPENETEQPGQPKEDWADNVRVLPSGVKHQQQEEKADEVAEENSSIVIDWRNIVPDNTFLRKWLEATTVDDCPEEYHFWMGLMAIGFAVGRHRTLADFKPVVPNLFVCLVGPSGARKSQSMFYLGQVIDKVMPYDYSDPLSLGVKDINSPGSAEYVVKAFSEPITDPSDPKKIMGYAPVKARIHFDELSTLVGVSGRMGSTMKPQLLEIYDSVTTIGSGSLTHGARIAKLPFGQVTSSTQNDSLTALLSKGDDVSGFMNRWVFASGKLKKQRSLGGVIVDIDEACQYLKGIRAWAGTVRPIEMTPEAYERWDHFFHQTIVPLKQQSEKGGSAILTRIDLLLKKLFVLFACNMRTDEITVEAVDQAIKLFPYLLATYGVVTKEMARTDDTDLTDKIIDTIKKFVTANGRGPSGSDIYKVLRHGRGVTIPGVQRQLLDMSKLGMISEAPAPEVKGRGRPPGTRWLIADAG